MLSKNLNSKIFFFEGFSIHFDSFVSAEQTLFEIFSEENYRFSCPKKQPNIIDAGSNIGIATCYFKKLYPNAVITCFEADPNVFPLLKENITVNQLPDIKLVNAALTSRQGMIDFYCQLPANELDNRGNSIIKEWGVQRRGACIKKVRSVLLSSYINDEVDFLKLDVEGAEQQILEDLEKTDKLKYIKQMAIEVHQADAIKAVNDVDRIVNILERNAFSFSLVEKDVTGLFPPQIADWADKIQPRLFVIRAES